jgi:hypothetical protein
MSPKAPFVVSAVALKSVVTPKNWKERSPRVFRYAWELFAITRGSFPPTALILAKCSRIAHVNGPGRVEES